MIGSGVAGMVSTLMGIRANAIGVGGLPGILAIRGEDMLKFILPMVIAIIVPIVLTFFFRQAGIFNKNDLAELIWSYYYDIDDLLLAESSNIYDPAFHSFIVKTGFYTDHKSQARLRDDWGYLFPIVLAKWIKQVELNYRPSTKGAKKNCGTLSTFFNKSFPRILVMSYIDYCRTVHKERAGTTPAADRFNFVDVPVEDLPSLSNPTIMDNELAYHILSISRPASLYSV